MSREILVPVDGSPKSIEGLEHALSTYGDESITAFHVMTPHVIWDDGERVSSESDEEWREAAREEADDIFASCRDLAGEYGVSISTETAVGEPWRAIVEYAEDHDVDHIIIGSHGRTDDSPLPLGSVAETVMRRSPVLVSVVR
jgi:nucleotide-binding universal stress UspA family protein